MSLKDGLVLYFKLDESQVTDDAIDAVAGRDGIQSGSPGVVSGKIKGGRSFTGETTKFFSVPSEPALQPSGDFTVGGWLLISSKSGGMSIFSKWDTGGSADQRQWTVFYNSSPDRLFFFISSDGIAQDSVQAANFGGFPLSEWTWFVAWHDGNAEQIGISVNNGTPNIASYSSGVFASGTNPIFLGANRAGLQRFMGFADEMFYYNRVLSEEERSELWNEGQGLAYPFSATSLRRRMMIRQQGMML